MSPSTWDLLTFFVMPSAEYLGWGGMPPMLCRRILWSPVVRKSKTPPGGLILLMFAVYRTADPPGPAAAG